MITNCHLCGEPLAHLEQLLAETSGGVQCRRCWSRITAGPRSATARGIVPGNPSIPSSARPARRDRHSSRRAA